MTKKAVKKSGFQALNDCYVIEEEPIEPTVDKASGFTPDVVSSIKSGLLVIPDVGQYALDKFPFRGKIISKGDKTRYKEIQIGTRVMFARLGGQRWTENDSQYITIREKDIHAIID